MRNKHRSFSESSDETTTQMRHYHNTLYECESQEHKDGVVNCVEKVDGTTLIDFNHLSPIQKHCANQAIAADVRHFCECMPTCPLVCTFSKRSTNCSGLLLILSRIHVVHQWRNFNCLINKQTCAFKRMPTGDLRDRSWFLKRLNLRISTDITLSLFLINANAQKN